MRTHSKRIRRVDRGFVAGNKLTSRQASIRAAFCNSYPSCITLVDFISPNKVTSDVVTALVKGVPRRHIAKIYKVSYSAIYEREVRFYRLAEQFFDLGTKVKKSYAASVLPFGNKTIFNR